MQVVFQADAAELQETSCSCAAGKVKDAKLFILDKVYRHLETPGTRYSKPFIPHTIKLLNSSDYFRYNLIFLTTQVSCN